MAASLVSSRLDYANFILHGASKKNVARVQRIQNALARVVTRTRVTDHITPALKSLHWQPIEYRVQYKLAVVTFKARTGTAPQYLCSLINDYRPSRSLRSSDLQLLTVPRSKSVFSSHGFRITAPLIWNSLPDNVRKSEEIGAFRSRLKTTLFMQAFNC